MSPRDLALCADCAGPVAFTARPGCRTSYNHTDTPSGTRYLVAFSDPELAAARPAPGSDHLDVAHTIARFVLARALQDRPSLPPGTEASVIETHTGRALRTYALDARGLVQPVNPKP